MIVPVKYVLVLRAVFLLGVLIALEVTSDCILSSVVLPVPQL